MNLQIYDWQFGNEVYLAYALKRQGFHLTAALNSKAHTMSLGTSPCVCVRFGGWRHCGVRQLDTRGAWASQCLDSGQNIQATPHLMKMWPFAPFSPALWREDKGNSLQYRTVSPDFGKARSSEDRYGSHSSFKTLQTLLWDCAAVGRESWFFSRKIKQIKILDFNAAFKLY